MRSTIIRRIFICALAAGVLFACGCDHTKKHDVSEAKARAIAREAYIYGFPMVANYLTMYRQAIDTTSRDYQGPFNVVHSSKSLAAPDDKSVVTLNSGTLYSYLWMDLRAEPVVVTMPKIEPNRYYTGQLVDLYTYNFAYLGTRAYGNEGGSFLIAGPGWNGATPAGIKAVIHSETQFAYILFRTQLFNAADLLRVNQIQDEYKAQTLSAFVNRPAPVSGPAIDWPKISDVPKGMNLFNYVSFLLQFCPPNPSEKDIFARFAQIDVGPGMIFDGHNFLPEVQRGIVNGIKDSDADLATVQQKIHTGSISSGEMHGTREFLNGNYLYRYAGAKLGLYGNSKQEALYFANFVNANRRPLDASARRHPL